MKRIPALIITAMLTFTFAGCGSGDDNSRTDGSQTNDSRISSDRSGNASSWDDSGQGVSDRGIFDLSAYRSKEVFGIEDVDMSETMNAKCLTYHFGFLSDGYEIEAYVSVPWTAMEKQEPCKCVVYCRGGNSDTGFLYPRETALVSTAFDRIAIGCELRGVGRSEGEDQFGGDDLHDVIRLIDLCEKTFSFVDMDDLCIAGTSRGGMMAYMAARQDKRIKRLISVSGVADLFSAYEERDEMKRVLVRHIGCTPQENPEEYEKRSAVLWADEITIPVMILHSTGDKQVAFTQAENMYQKLSDHTDCTFIKHDDELHGIIHEEDYAKIRQWLNN